jgi:hypothetical protein
MFVFLCLPQSVARLCRLIFLFFGLTQRPLEPSTPVFVSQ